MPKGDRPCLVANEVCISKHHHDCAPHESTLAIGNSWSTRSNQGDKRSFENPNLGKWLIDNTRQVSEIVRLRHIATSVTENDVNGIACESLEFDITSMLADSSEQTI